MTLEAASIMPLENVIVPFPVKEVLVGRKRLEADPRRRLPSLARLPSFSVSVVDGWRVSVLRLERESVSMVTGESSWTVREELMMASKVVGPELLGVPLDQLAGLYQSSLS